jgi:hypothetical protein
MVIGARVKSAIQGALWLVRSNGMRRRLQALEDRLVEMEATLTRIANLDKRLAPAHAWRTPVSDLRAYERTVYSQNGEDGIIEEILRRVGVESQYFVEFGVETGIECNCARLALADNWSGLFLEGEPVCFEQLARRYEPYPMVQCVETYVTSENIQRLLEENAVPIEFDVLSIDIDGNDYWVWKAIRRWRPRVVVIEYNASRSPQERWVMAENLKHRWDGPDYFGASLGSLVELGREKGYTLVGTNSLGVNAFFVREDLATDGRFLDPVVSYHYSPPRYGPMNGGHPPGSGPAVAL